MSSKNKNLLQSISRAGESSRAVALPKLQSSAPAAAPIAEPKAAPQANSGSATADRERLNLYLTGEDHKKLGQLRAIMTAATGGLKAVSGNALILTALRAVDLSQKERLIEIYLGVQAEDRRRRGGAA